MSPDASSSSSGSDSESGSELLQQDFSKIKDTAKLQKIIRRMQVAKNSSEIQQRRQFGDRSNIPDDATQRKRKRSKNGTSRKRQRLQNREPVEGRSDDEENEVPGAADDDGPESEMDSPPPPPQRLEDEDVAFMRTAQLFLYTGGLWLEGAGRVLNHKLDRKWDEKKRFSGEVGDKIQGQLRVIVPMLPIPYRERISTIKLPLVIKKLSRALTDWRPNISTRLRRQAWHAIFSCSAADLLDSKSRFDKFKTRIGYRPENGKYRELSVAILHGDESPKYNKNTFLLHPCLFRLYAALTHGQTAAVSMQAQYDQAKAANPDAEPVVVAPSGSNDDMTAILDLCEVTPHAIALTAVLAVWALSADNCLRPNGQITAIDYERRFERYLELLLHGLEKKDPAVLNIFKVWNEVLYANKKPARGEGDDDDDELEGALAQMGDDEVSGDDE